MQAPRKLIRAALAAPLVAVALAAGGAASASAATATLSIAAAPNAPGYYDVSVFGQASGVFPEGLDASIRLWGEDQWFDDHLATMPLYRGFAYDNWFARTIRVHRSTLNEDWEGRDEIYGGVRIYDRRTGKQVQSAETKRFYGYF